MTPRMSHFIAAFVVAATMAAPVPVAAVPVMVSDPYLQLINLGYSQLGLAAGEFIRFGATSVEPNALAGTRGVGSTIERRPPGNLFEAAIFFNPSPSVPNFFSRLVPDLAYLRGPWTLEFTNGPNSFRTTLSLPENAQQAPFVHTITLSGDGMNPRFTWTAPPGALVNGYRVNLIDTVVRGFDANTGAFNSGQITTAVLPPTTTTYTVNGATLVQGRRYTVEIALLRTFDGSSTDLSNANVYASSRTYADFTPQPGDMPIVNLPIVNSDGRYVYHVPVEVGQTYYLDPTVAVGYDFRIGAGDPNFASVVLPDLGDPLYDLYLWDDGEWRFEAALAPATVFDLGPGGVDRFRIGGIDPRLALDPRDTTAFMTGVTFVTGGTFTGTQTPLDAEAFAPEPTLPALLAAGLVAWITIGRRRPGFIVRSDRAPRTTHVMA